MKLNGFWALSFIAFASFVPITAHGHAVGVSLSGSGTVLIDGMLSPGEWDNAGSILFPVNVPGGGSTPGTLFVLNDSSNLYLALRFARPAGDRNSAGFEFDNDHSGNGPGLTTGDDVLLLNPEIGFFDEVRTSEPPCAIGSLCGVLDTDVGGANDGNGAFSNNGTFSSYEFSHPLNSADDAHDFSLSQGSTVGFTFSIRIIDSNGVLADTDDFLGVLGGDILIAPPLSPIIPEPGTFLLLGSGVAGLALWGLRKQG